MSDGRRLYGVVAASTVVVYLGALWNHFAYDDAIAIVSNSLVHGWSGLWEAFAHPYYWPAETGGRLYRPLVAATYVLDWHLGPAAWFHAVNLLWHAAASVAAAALARRWAGTVAALVAGLLFAVHPVHVEAVAYVVGRAELMSGLLAMLAVYAAVERGSVAWSAAALVPALLSKENAAVVPALIVWAWVVGLRPRPPRRRLAAFVASWIAIAALYGGVRWAVLQPSLGGQVAPVFVGQSPVAVRLTAVAALADVGRLLVFPLTLRADYSPAERTIVTSVLDARFLTGVVAVAVWAALLVVAWRAQRRVEAFGLGWIAIAYLPVANLLFPIGILLAERTLYLPSAGLVLAAGAVAARLPARRLAPVSAVVLLAAAVRTAWRVPVWRDDTTLTLSVLDDSPRSYFGLTRAGVRFQQARQPARALDIYRRAIQAYDRSPILLVAAADAALTTEHSALADSLLRRAAELCGRCQDELRFEETVARARGDAAVADSLVARAHGMVGP